MAKFMAYIDYFAEVEKNYEYISFEAHDILDAMEKVDDICEEKRKKVGKIYLARIMQKHGKIETVENDVKAETYVGILCQRYDQGWYCGWHPNTEKYSESSHAVKYFMHKDGNWIENVSWKLEYQA